MAAGSFVASNGILTLIVDRHLIQPDVYQHSNLNIFYTLDKGPAFSLAQVCGVTFSNLTTLNNYTPCNTSVIPEVPNMVTPNDTCVAFACANVGAKILKPSDFVNVKISGGFCSPNNSLDCPIRIKNSQGGVDLAHLIQPVSLVHNFSRSTITKTGIIIASGDAYISATTANATDTAGMNATFLLRSSSNSPSALIGIFSVLSAIILISLGAALYRVKLNGKSGAKNSDGNAPTGEVIFSNTSTSADTEPSPDTTTLPCLNLDSNTITVLVDEKKSQFLVPERSNTLGSVPELSRTATSSSQYTQSSKLSSADHDEQLFEASDNNMFHAMERLQQRGMSRQEYREIAVTMPILLPALPEYASTNHPPAYSEAVLDGDK